MSGMMVSALIGLLVLIVGLIIIRFSPKERGHN